MSRRREAPVSPASSEVPAIGVPARDRGGDNEQQPSPEAAGPSERLAASIVQSIPIGLHLYHLEDDGRLVLTGANPAADAILGFDHGPLIGLEIRDAFPAHRDSDIPAVYSRIAREGGTWHDESVRYKDQRIESSFEVRAFQTGPRSMAAAFTDITERRIEEADLRDSEKRFAAMFEQAPLGYQSLDSDGRFLDVNEQWLTMLGYDRRDVIGAWFGDFLAPEYVDAFRERFPLFVSLGAIHSEFEMLRKDGTRLTAAFEGRIGRNADGEFRQTHCILSDVTEQRRAENALRESEERYRSIVSALHEGVILQAADGTVLAFNETAAEVFGLGREEGTGGTSAIHEWRTYREDGSPFPEAEQPSFVTLRTGRPCSGVVMAVRAPSGERWVDVSTAPMTRPGEPLPYAVAISFQDITERKTAAEKLREAQDRLQAILDNAPLLVYVVDLEGRFTLVNRTAQMLLAPAGGLLGRKREEFLPEDVAAAHRANDLEVVARRVPISFEEFNKEPDGEHVYLSTKFPMFDRADDVIGVCGISLDITDRKRADKELSAYREGLESVVRERTAELEEASRAKNAFMASMSHELRTPLNSIIGFTGIMLQGLSGELNPEQRAQLTMVNHSGRQLLALVNDVLDLEQIEAGAVTIDLEPVDLPHLVEMLERTIRPMAEDVGLTLRVDSRAAPATIAADRRKLEQILLNLLSNAVKYTERGDVSLTIGVLPDREIAFAVSDTGIGIAQADHERVFEQFSQLMPKSGAKYPGSGLGLAISKQMATMLGGRIEIESAAGEGSTFTLVLPLG